MIPAQSNRLVNIITLAVFILTAFQSSLLTIPIQDNHTITILSGITMGLLTIVTYVKNWLSDQIGKKAQAATTIFLIVALLGGWNDIKNYFPLSEAADQWIRWILTLVIAVLNVCAKWFFPTTEPRKY